MFFQLRFLKDCLPELCSILRPCTTRTHSGKGVLSEALNQLDPVFNQRDAGPANKRRYKKACAASDPRDISLPVKPHGFRGRVGRQAAAHCRWL